jgi:hypothetical protein
MEERKYMRRVPAWNPLTLKSFNPEASGEGLEGLDRVVKVRVKGFPPCQGRFRVKV